MRLDDGEQSQNIDDRRGLRVSRGVAGGGIGTIAMVLIALFFVVDPSLLLQGAAEPLEERDRDQSALRAPRTAGRLLFGHLGQLCAS